jgi:type IV pilus assembly protein PilC
VPVIRYAWHGRTRTGRTIRGERLADTPAALATQLRREQIVVTKIEPARANRLRSGRVGSRSLAIFTRQLAVMIGAGLPIVTCLDLLARDEPDRRLADAIASARVEVEGGSSLAEALSRQPVAFDDLYTNMVAAGEAGGVLEVMLERLAALIEKQARLTSHVRSALAYPAIVVGVAVVVVGVILWKVVPAFAELFAGLGAELPLPTRLVIWASEQSLIVLPLVAFTGAIGWGMAGRRRRTPDGRLRFDRAVLDIPLVGPVLRKVAVARFCRTLGTLLRSGVPILEGLDITARTAGNAALEQAIFETRRRVERGEALTVPLKASGMFPPVVLQMVGAGESTGALDVMLTRIADFYDTEIDDAIARMLAMLEPVLIVVLGLIVGAIVISMYLPLFEVAGQLA